MPQIVLAFSLILIYSRIFKYVKLITEVVTF